MESSSKFSDLSKSVLNELAHKNFESAKDPVKAFDRFEKIDSELSFDEQAGKRAVIENFQDNQKASEEKLYELSDLFSQGLKSVIELQQTNCYEYIKQIENSEQKIQALNQLRRDQIDQFSAVNSELVLKVIALTEDNNKLKAEVGEVKDNFEKNITDLNQRVESLQSDNASLEADLSELTIKHKGQIEALNLNHSKIADYLFAKIAENQYQYEIEMTDFKEQIKAAKLQEEVFNLKIVTAENELTNRTLVYEADIRAKDLAYATELSARESSYEAELSARESSYEAVLNSKTSAYENELIQLKAELAAKQFQIEELALKNEDNEKIRAENIRLAEIEQGLFALTHDLQQEISLSDKQLKDISMVKLHVLEELSLQMDLKNVLYTENSELKMQVSQLREVKEQLKEEYDFNLDQEISAKQLAQKELSEAIQINEELIFRLNQDSLSYNDLHDELSKEIFAKDTVGKRLSAQIEITSTLEKTLAEVRSQNNDLVNRLEIGENLKAGLQNALADEKWAVDLILSAEFNFVEQIISEGNLKMSESTDNQLLLARVRLAFEKLVKLAAENKILVSCLRDQESEFAKETLTRAMQIADLKQEKNLLLGQIQTIENNITVLSDELERKDDRCNHLEINLVNLEVLKGQNQQLEAKITELASQYETQFSKLTGKYDAQQAEITDRYMAEVDDITSRYEIQISDLNNQLQSALKKANEPKINGLETLNDYLEFTELQISELETQMKNTSILSLNTVESQLEQLLNQQTLLKNIISVKQASKAK
jgi:hypothetical protein